MDIWTPRVERTPGLIRPVRLDPLGVDGPTRGQARGRAWRRTSRGWYVPAHGPPDCVEQRILEQSVRVPAPAGGLTGWAALRWYGARYFDGLHPATRMPRPVPISVGTWQDLGRDDRIVVSREVLWPPDRHWVDGVACSVPDRCLFDELRTLSFRHAVIAADMTLAAGVTTVDGFVDFVTHHRTAFTGVPYVRTLIPWLCADSRSPLETWTRLVWEIDAGLPRPLVNQPVFDHRGHLIGVPDLLDPVAGVVGEYDGGHHDDPAQRGADVDREERFRDHGLEYFAVVRSHRARPHALAARMRAVRGRAAFLPVERRAWTLDQPAWWPARRPA